MPKPKQKPTIGLVLSGGGARGAHEVGVLSWIADHRPELLERVGVVTGASIGAINAVFLASHGMGPDAVRQLEKIWLNLSMDRVMGLTIRQTLREIAVDRGDFFGAYGRLGASLFRTGPLERLIRKVIAWNRIPAMMRSGRLKGLAVASTEISSGRTHLFSQRVPGQPVSPWARADIMTRIETNLQPAHIVASASIPLLFRPVRVGDYWYTDGSLRQNTPLSPALRLGADRLLVLSVGGVKPPEPVPGAFPGFGQLVGKLFNSLFLDRTRWDIDRMERINDVLDSGIAAYGDGFLERMHVELIARGRRPYRPIRYVNVHPTVDIGDLAAEIMQTPKELKTNLRGPRGYALRRFGPDAGDAMSYLLFDGGFARVLMDVGRADGAAAAERIDSLLAD